MSSSPNETIVSDQSLYDYRIGGVFGGGLGYPLNSSITFGVDIAYIYLRTTAHTQTADFTSGFPGGIAIINSDNGLTLDTLRVTAGIRYHFFPLP
jgi:outer membrane protein W